MPTKPACNGDTDSCQWSSCRKGICDLEGERLPVPEACPGCGNLAYTVTCRICRLLDEEVSS